MADYLIWFIAGGVFVVGEIFMPGFVIIWFGIGAFAAGLSALLGASQPLQVIVFIVVSVGSLVPAKLFLKKKEKESIPVGAERFIGMAGIVTKPISPASFGEVKIGGELWIASAEYEIAQGEWVIVEKIDGAHLVVHRKDEGDSE